MSVGKLGGSISLKVKITKKDMIWSYIGYFLSLFSSVLVLPFVMKLVPSDELGLWYTFLSFGQFVTLLDRTFNTCISRSITYAWAGMQMINAEGYNVIKTSELGTNFRLLASIFKTCKKVFGIISIISLAVMASAGTVYIGYIAREMSGIVWIPAWIIYGVSVFFTIYYSYWTVALNAVGALKQAQQITVLSKLVYIALSLAGLLLGYGLISLTVSNLISGIILRILGKKFLYNYESIGEKISKYEKSITVYEIKDNFAKIWHNAKKVGLSCLSAFLITQTTILVSSAYLGLEETASYGLCLQLVTAMLGVAQIYFTAVKPKLTELKVSGEEKKEEFISGLSFATTIYWFLFWIEVITLIIVGVPILTFLKPNTEIPLFMLFFLSVYSFLEYNHSMFAAVIEMSNTVPYVKASVISAICISVGEFIVASSTSLGIYGLMAVQCIVQLAYNNWKWPMVIMKEYHISPWRIITNGTKEGILLFKSNFSQKVKKIT